MTNMLAQAPDNNQGPWAALENDLRRVLAYSLNNQLGFMVVGIGIGTVQLVPGGSPREGPPPS